TSNGYHVYRSYDMGFNWVKVFTHSTYVRRLFTTSTGHHIIRENNSRLLRVSPDFSSFTTWTGHLIVSPLNSTHGLAENDNGVIMYAEYGVEDGKNYRIFRSVDDGVSWEV